LIVDDDKQEVRSFWPRSCAPTESGKSQARSHDTITIEKWEFQDHGPITSRPFRSHQPAGGPSADQFARSSATHEVRRFADHWSDATGNRQKRLRHTTCSLLFDQAERLHDRNSASKGGYRLRSIGRVLTGSAKMNWDQIKGKWKEMRGKAKEHWGKLTDDDLDIIDGKKDQLSGMIQQRYGVAKEEAERQVKEFADRCC
jgi:uncharacterized protein YjbJ (UPF0337 family)